MKPELDQIGECIETLDNDASSPFAVRDAGPISAEKFADREWTAKGEARAQVALSSLQTLWFNTGTLCNLACKTCYIESSPQNDALVYISLEEVRHYLDEIVDRSLPTREIGFTGGEPFMNPEIIPIIQLCLDRGFHVLVLSNAMRPMRRFEDQLLNLDGRERLTIRVSLDHHTREVHEAERGTSWEKAVDGLAWLARHGFNIAVAGRRLGTEDEQNARQGFADMFARLGISLNAADPKQLVLFPAMDENADTVEITGACWEILGVDPNDLMCSSSRMVVKRKDEETPRVAACTLLPYHPDFDMGRTLTEAAGDVRLNHPHCARFCVLGGSSCSA